MGDPVHQTPIYTLGQMFKLNVLTLVTLTSTTVPYKQRKCGGKIMPFGANAALSGFPNMGSIAHLSRRYEAD
jgi:short-subunit dehydrogenase